jgi:hypothetical protein
MGIPTIVTYRCLSPLMQSWDAIEEAIRRDGHTFAAIIFPPEEKPFPGIPEREYDGKYTYLLYVKGTPVGTVYSWHALTERVQELIRLSQTPGTYEHSHYGPLR